ncbi:hypothetical protein M413DRAFT_438426 [Hebeloma cylindrosporum]|uniref:Vacuolar import and degradation protein 21 n=1 Tax=Hebeloma cylindrosporum TaxID=76867 RepID=A0A0C2YHJ9_HEBCY|nr:hypothetical protein M413DRAFT_438426 [Hebeloma cylindrosporum h7]
MPQTSNDPRIQERLLQLNGIVARRNEFLSELFRMVRSGRDATSSLIPNDEDEYGLETFLQRFDFVKDSDRGSITNFKETEIPFLALEETHPSFVSPPTTTSSSLADGKQATSTRTTRSRSRVAEAVKSPSPIVEKPLTAALYETRPLRKVEYLLPSAPKPSSPSTRTTDVEQLDEDDDELDLIGPSTSFIHREQLSPRRITAIPSTNVNHGLISTGEVTVLEQEPSHTISTPEGLLKGAPPVSPPVESSIEEEQEGHADMGIEGTKKRTTPQHPNDVSEKESDKRMEVDEEPEVAQGQNIEPTSDEEMDVDKETTTDAANSLRIRPPNELVPSPTVVNFEEGVSGTALQQPVLDMAEAPPLGQVTKKEIQSDTVSNPHESGPPVAEVLKPPKYTPIHFPLPPTIQEAILIPAPTISEEETVFNLDFEPEIARSSPIPTIIENRQQYDLKYTLPPLGVLPPDFTRKVKPRRKKDGKREKDDAVPMGLTRWGATIMANPLWKRVAKATKCLNTREWGVAMSELRLIRTLERIDALKDGGRWAFRQPKKQRGVGGLLKTHWDYLLDEMKWMRVDFREERRWKMTLAYHLSTAILEWHLAKTSEERQRAGICVKWKAHTTKDHIDEDPMEVDTSQPNSTSAGHPNMELLGVNYGSDEEDEEELDKEQHTVIDALEPAAIIEDALNDNTEGGLKNEDVDDNSALHLIHPKLDPGDRQTSAPVAETDHAHPQVADSRSGLKSDSNDPMLGDPKSSSQSTNGDADPPVAEAPKFNLAPLRERLAYAGDDQLFVNLDDIQRFDPVNLNTLFPDLQPYGLLDVPVLGGASDGKKKAEKRSDKDDPNKRVEDTSYTRLYPVGRFMFNKPTLIGPLQPAKRWKEGGWLPMEQTPVLPGESDNGTRVMEDSASELFDGRTNTSASNFAFQLHSASVKDKDSRKKSEKLWSSSDDSLLKALVERYSTNWPLISECFNSSRVTTVTDKRTAIDCFERWKERFGSERKAIVAETAHASEDVITPTSSNQMTTRGVKRLASASVSSPSTAFTSDARKRLRHASLSDAVRRAAKKRADAAQKAQAMQRKSSSVVHETHNQFSKLPRLAPAELSRLKAEKDLKNTQDLAMARKIQEEQIRQNMLQRDQTQRAGAGLPAVQPQAAQQQQQQQQQGPGSQAQPPQQPQAQQLAQQQMAQLQQLQQQQQQQRQDQNQRPNVAATVANRPTRPTGAPNSRPVNSQTQILQQARALQIPVQLQAGGQTNLPQGLLQGQGAGTNSGNSFYGLPPNVTQEQVEIFRAQLLTAQAQQQQGSQPGFGT